MLVQISVLEHEEMYIILLYLYMFTILHIYVLCLPRTIFMYMGRESNTKPLYFRRISNYLTMEILTTNRQVVEPTRSPPTDVKTLKADGWKDISTRGPLRVVGVGKKSGEFFYHRLDVVNKTQWQIMGFQTTIDWMVWFIDNDTPLLIDWIFLMKEKVDSMGGSNFG